VEDGSLIHRRIIAVKIDNAPEARPQSGLSLSDLTFEELAEAGLTRFMLFYLQNEPDTVGPVRSARPTDISLGKEWSFLLAYAGAGKTLTRLLGESLIPLFKAPELGQPLDGTPYRRAARRAAPHNLYVKIAAVREAAGQDPGIAPEVAIRPFSFREPAPETGPLRSISMPYIPSCAVSWRYDADGNVWKRWMASAPHVDALNGQQLQAENVVVQYAEHVLANVEPDSVGNPVYDAIVRGQNTARLFHSGQMFEGTWSKPEDDSHTEYLLPDGTPMPFRPGKVWIHIVPLDFQATWG
jgi:hypothetical protein